MDAGFIRERIAKLCMEKGISEYSLSVSIGMNKSYINRITTGKTLPSTGALLLICDYFDISPKEFFDEDVETPLQLAELMRVAGELSPEKLSALSTIAKLLAK